MLLVHEIKGRAGKWEVAWAWLPYFLASDRDLIKKVDKQLTKELRGALRMGTEGEDLLRQLHNKVLDLVVAAHPLPGLREYLEGLEKVVP